MDDVGVTDATEAQRQQFDSTWGRALIAIAILALVLVLAGIVSMVWYMEKKRCKPEDCEKCSVGGEDRDGTAEVETQAKNAAIVVCKQR